MKLDNGTEMRHRLYKTPADGWVIAHQARKGPGKPWVRIGIECTARPKGIGPHRKCGGIVYTAQPLSLKDRVFLPIDICSKCGADVTKRK